MRLHVTALYNVHDKCRGLQPDEAVAKQKALGEKNRSSAQRIKYPRPVLSAGFQEASLQSEIGCDQE